MGMAPWQMSRFAPREWGDVMAPGTTRTSRPARSASSAVENVPEGNPASTISVAFAKLREKLLPFAFVGDVRGKGLLLGVEIVRDKATKEPYPVGLAMAEKLTLSLVRNGVIVYPGNGNADGENGDQFLIAPPLTLSKDQADELVRQMVAGFNEFADISGIKA